MNQLLKNSPVLLALNAVAVVGACPFIVNEQGIILL